MRYRSEYTFLVHQTIRTAADDDNIAAGDFRTPDRVVDMVALHVRPTDPCPSGVEGDAEGEEDSNFVLFDPRTGATRSLNHFLKLCWKENRSVCGILIGRDVSRHDGKH